MAVREICRVIIVSIVQARKRRFAFRRNVPPSATGMINAGQWLRFQGNCLQGTRKQYAWWCQGSGQHESTQPASACSQSHQQAPDRAAFVLSQAVLSALVAAASTAETDKHRVGKR